MKVVTAKQRALDAKDEWFRQYRGEIQFGHARPSFSPVNKRQIYERLCALEVVTPDTVDAAIGNNSWTRIMCDECLKKVDIVVELNGSEWDMVYCRDCLSEAMQKMENEE
jgi:hypothetical protein